MDFLPFVDEDCDKVPCICDRLRTCEQRVRMEDDDYAYVAVQAEADGRMRGWNEALDTAREAVTGLPLTGGWTTPDGVIEEIDKAKAVAAIDALRWES